MADDSLNSLVTDSGMDVVLIQLEPPTANHQLVAKEDVELVDTLVTGAEVQFILSCLGASDPSESEFHEGSETSCHNRDMGQSQAVVVKQIIRLEYRRVGQVHALASC